VTGLADLPTVVLGPLAGRPESDWHRAPAGKWTPAQIVHHLALSIEGSARTFEARRARGPMTRRRRTLGERLRHFLIMRLGWPPPAAQAPSAVWPAEHPDPRAIERQLRDGLERFLSLEAELLPARGSDLFVKHPALGDLTFPEWQRFHVWHSTHHAAQIRARLES
jgi:Protein of unknown function (DUF1569)